MVAVDSVVDGREDKGIFGLLKRFLGLNLSSVYDEKATGLNFGKTDGRMGGDFEQRNENFFTFRDSTRNGTTTRDNLRSLAHVLLVTGQSTLRQLIDHDKLTTNGLIFQGSSDRFHHCLRKGYTTLWGFQSLGYEHFTLDIY